MSLFQVHSMETILQPAGLGREEKITVEQLNTQRYVLCSDHFEETQFNQPGKYGKLMCGTLCNVPNAPARLDTNPDRLKRRMSRDHSAPTRKRRRTCVETSKLEGFFVVTITTKQAKKYPCV
jgi:hypothetical protein